MPPDSRKHILFVIVGISAGTGTFCKSLGAGLRQHFGDEFKVSLLTFRPDANEPDNARHFDESHVLGTDVRDDWRRVIALPKSVMQLRGVIGRLNPDLVFTIGTFSNIVTSFAVRDRPVVMSDHLNMTLRLRESRFGGATRWFMQRAYPGRLMVVACNELAEDLKSNFGVTRSVIVPNGIDASIVQERAKEPPAIELPERYMISVGRLTSQKDLGTLLHAFSHARLRGLREDLLIVGDGDERAMLRVLSEQLGFPSAVHFAGHQPNPYPLIQRARALVLSSIWEGFAYVPIEAMALGVPVISTSCPSGPVEILGNGEFGLLVPPRNPIRLSEAMHKLSKDDALHAHLSAKARERAAQLSVRNMAAAYRDVFLAELKSRRSG